MNKAKIAFATITVFALTLGAALAMEGGKELYNGITDFSGRSYDTISDLGPAASGPGNAGVVEGSSAGGMRSDGPGLEPHNGITDFTGRSYDTLSDLGPAASSGMRDSSVESSGAGGLRSEEPAAGVSNGITNFSGKSYDTLWDLAE